MMMRYANGQAIEPLYIEYCKGAGFPAVRADFEMVVGGLGSVRLDATINVTENYRIYVRAYPTHEPPGDNIWRQATPGWVFRAFYEMRQFGNWRQHAERPIHPETLIPSIHAQ